MVHVPTPIYNKKNSTVLHWSQEGSEPKWGVRTHPFPVATPLLALLWSSDGLLQCSYILLTNYLLSQTIFCYIFRSCCWEHRTIFQIIFIGLYVISRCLNSRYLLDGWFACLFLGRVNECACDSSLVGNIQLTLWRDTMQLSNNNNHDGSRLQYARSDCGLCGPRGCMGMWYIRIDCQKAFDKVSHSNLLVKNKKYEELWGCWLRELQG